MMREEIRKVIYKTVPGSADFGIEHETELISTGVIDSYSFVDLVRSLEERFGFVVPPEELVFDNFQSIVLIEQIINKLKRA